MDFGEKSSAGMTRIAALVLLALLVSGCASRPSNATGEGVLREGRVRVSETQEATYRLVPNPGLLRVREDFSSRARVGESFVLGETGEKNRYCRLSSKDWSHLTLVHPEPPWEELIPDGRIGDLRLALDFRLSDDGESVLSLFARQVFEEDRSVYLSIERERMVFRERRHGEDRLLAEVGELQLAPGAWNRCEMRLAGEELAVSLNGEELLRLDGVEWREPGGVLLEYRGSVDIDNVSLFSLDHSYGEPGHALVIESLAEDFGGDELLPWWSRDGNGSGLETGVGGVLLSGSDDYQSVAGVRSVALFNGEGAIRARFEEPPERTACTIAIGKPGVMDSLAFTVREGGFALARYDSGFGRRILQGALPEGALAPGGAVELELMVTDSTLYAAVNGVPLFQREVPPEEAVGSLFVGYLGHFGPEARYAVESVEVTPLKSDRVRPSRYPEGSTVVSSSEEELEPYEKAAPLLQHFDDGSLRGFHTGANERSRAEVEIREEDERDGGYLALSFTMEAGSGLHAYAARGLGYDLSEYGGIAFRARGREISRAHVSMGEAASELVGDRVDAYFPVSEEWREYRLPFTRDYFALNADPLLSGSDGVFDYSHADWLMFEVYQHEGEGELHIDDVRFLPPGAMQKLTSRLTVDGFEGEGAASRFGLERSFYAGDSGGMELKLLQEDGARGSTGHALISGAKREWESLELSYWGGMPTSGHHGLGFSVRGKEVHTIHANLIEIEQGGAAFRPLFEEHRFALPVSERWVEWRLPFAPLASRPLPYRELGNGVLDGWYLEGFSFFLPGAVEAEAMELHLDEIFAYETPREKAFRVGLFFPDGGSAPDRRVASVVDSVFRFNLDRVQNYEILGGLEASELESAFSRAAEGGVDFFLWPSYRRTGETLRLVLDLCNVAAGSVTKTIETETVVGLDIFHDLDLLSTEVINALADTNLAFEDRLSREGGEWVLFSDSLDKVAPYWLTFDFAKVTAAPSGALRLSGERRSEEEGSAPLLPMVLTEPYFGEIGEFSLEAGPGREGALFLWNYRGRDGYNAVLLEDGRVTVSINGMEEELSAPELSEAEGWVRLAGRRDESGYTIRLNGRELGRVAGPDVPFGRVGFAVPGGEVAFRNLEVRFRE